MAAHQDGIDVYLESGQKRVLAVAVAWPGWCRSGKDDASALEALLHAGPRYQEILRSAKVPFRAPDDPGQLQVRERVKGGGGTDMAVPSIVLAGDAEPMSPAELERAIDSAPRHVGTPSTRLSNPRGARNCERVLVVAAASSRVLCDT